MQDIHGVHWDGKRLFSSNLGILVLLGKLFQKCICVVLSINASKELLSFWGNILLNHSPCTFHQVYPFSVLWMAPFLFVSFGFGFGYGFSLRCFIRFRACWNVLRNSCWRTVLNNWCGRTHCADLKRLFYPGNPLFTWGWLRRLHVHKVTVLHSKFMLSWWTRRGWVNMSQGIFFQSDVFL